MEQERDFVVFKDEDGSEFELDVIDYFEHKGQEYAVLMDLEALVEEGSEDEEQDVYIMKIVVSGDMEEFLPADEDKMDELAHIVEARLSEGCGCNDPECGCHAHGPDCGCGCNGEC